MGDVVKMGEEMKDYWEIRERKKEKKKEATFLGKR